jgi:hypothetical protein
MNHLYYANYISGFVIYTKFTHKVILYDLLNSQKGRIANSAELR